MKNTTIVIFGATGDLAKRKIFPALYRILQNNSLEDVICVGVAFDDVNSHQMIEAARPFISDADNDHWKRLQNCSYYKKMDFTISDDFDGLRTFVEECEKKHGIHNGNRLFYVATSSQFFSSITNNISHTGLIKRLPEHHLFWHRIVYEKPFGHDQISAHEINECIKNTLNEFQVYRIDHYLTKEVVNNIAMIRFTNVIFEPLWSHQYIEQVHITLSESIGIEDRGRYYDLSGAVRDVVQNHMLELLALIGMEMPEKLTGDCIRAERAKVIEKIRFEDGLLGQYESYTQEKDVDPASRTETYALLQFFVDNERWTGVPFYLKTGKCLDKKETVIHIKFKQAECLLLHGCPLESNWLTIKIAPDAVFLLTLNAKMPGVMNQVMPVGMEFCHSCLFGVQTPQAYEVLLEEVMKGEQSIAVRFDEIEYAWKVIDALYAHNLPLYTYKKGSSGPQEVEQFEQKHGMRVKT